MARKTSKPPFRVGNEGFGNMHRLAACSPEDNLRTQDNQSNFAVAHLSRRYGLPIATALTVAELAGIGAQP